MKNLDGNISMNQREKILASIELLSSMRDKIIARDNPLNIFESVKSSELRYQSDLLMWLIEQLQQSLLVLNAIPDE